jgi:hypothetical protein
MLRELEGTAAHHGGDAVHATVLVAAHELAVRMSVGDRGCPAHRLHAGGRHCGYLLRRHVAARAVDNRVPVSGQGAQALREVGGDQVDDMGKLGGATATPAATFVM